MSKIFLKNKAYIYCSETNTLLNAEFEKVYQKFTENRAVNFEEITLDKDIIISKIKKIRQIIFEATQQCGLKCKYCIYNEQIYNYNRKPTNLKIDFYTAKKAIECLYSYIKDRKKKEISIGFYGGEPLINFVEIKKIVNYAKIKFRNWNIIFTITTNGTLLDNEKMHFLIDNKFKTLVSIDGPKENHDAKRLYIDGKGTYEDIIKNLTTLKELNSEYYKEYVNFSIVYSKDLSLRSMFDFFNKYELVKENHSNLGYITEANSNYYDLYTYNVDTLKRERNGIFASILKKVKAKADLSSIETNFITALSLLKSALDSRKFTILSGACCFDERLFISANGDFHLCEKINDKFSFGNVETGFNLTRMVEIAQQYIDLLKKHCLNCEIRFLCLRCYANFAKNGYFELDQSFCENNKYTVRKMLEELIYLKEAGYSL